MDGLVILVAFSNLYDSMHGRKEAEIQVMQSPGVIPDLGEWGCASSRRCAPGQGENGSDVPKW